MTPGFRLPAVIVILCGLSGSAGPAMAGAGNEGLAAQALDLVNEARGERNLDPLTLASALSEAAARHARDMAAQDYFAHEAPNGGTVFERVMTAGGERSWLVAENIAKCGNCGAEPDAEDLRGMHRGWMSSPGHRANILDPDVSRFGFAVAVDGDDQYYVQTFAGPGATQGNDRSRIGPAAAVDRAAGRLAVIRAEAGLPPLDPAAALNIAARDLAARLAVAEPAALDQAALARAIPEPEAADWRRIGMLAFTCGGCGPRPVAGDVAAVFESWAGAEAQLRQIEDPAFDAFGFAVAADGDGAKAAVLILGQRAGR